MSVQGHVTDVEQGEVFGRLPGVQLTETQGENILTNLGHIEGSAAGVAVYPAANTVVINVGSIVGYAFGVVVDNWRADAGRTLIVNTGLIQVRTSPSRDTGLAVSASSIPVRSTDGLP